MTGAADAPLVAICLLATATMGFAIQRGGTCMVAALEEAASRRWPSKLLALAEASIWVAGLLALAAFFGMPLARHPDYAMSGVTIAGGLLLGAGALINGACVFGSIARIGSGNWHYLLTPAGYFAGSLLHHALGIAPPGGRTMAEASPFGWFALLVLAPFIAYRLTEVVFAARQGRLAAKIWLSHHATIVIGISFTVLLLLAGPWTYTEALARLAHTGQGFSGFDGVLFAGLLAGAVAGGWHARGRIAWDRGVAASCLTGGALMGFASSLIPGGNDDLILAGLPMLHPHAWLAIASMALAIFLGLIIKQCARKRQAGLLENASQ